MSDSNRQQQQSRQRALGDATQAAVDANLSGPALRGVLTVIEAVIDGLDGRYLPPRPHGVIAALCENLTAWVVVGSPYSPYVHVRAPIAPDGIAIMPVDLRTVREGEACPQGIDRTAWAKVVAAARTYRERDVLLNETGGNA